MDILSSEKRSRNMAAIHNKDTKPELLLRKWLFSMGFRYRLHTKYIPGCPDIFLRKYNTAIFVNGCFWHRHANCKYAYTPKSRIDFWEKKFNDNIRRDCNVRNQLQSQGIRFLIIWECTIKEMQKSEIIKIKNLEEIMSFFQSDQQIMEL